MYMSPAGKSKTNYWKILLGKHLFEFYHVADSISMRVLTVFYIRCEIAYILVCLPRPQSQKYLYIHRSSQLFDTCN